MNSDRSSFRWPRVAVFCAALVCALAVAAYFLFEEHRVHMLGALPWLLLLACPLMHLFMHHGHGGHGEPRDGGEAGGRDTHRHDSDSPHVGGRRPL